ncbi:hypothetical protein MalM25_31420 [Planctomycetes bacterium MalM25]|nr:hypothetical protein MalM25_31420 [Planctomycetes bacterium MalM25]
MPSNTIDCEPYPSRSLGFTIAFSSVLLLTGWSAAGTSLYSFDSAVLNRVDYQDEQVVTINLSPGVPVPGGLANGRVGLAADPLSGFVYSMQTTNVGGVLLRTDPNTGVVDYVGPGSFLSQDPPLPVDPTSVWGLSFDPFSQSLYTINALPQSEVIKIDPLTGLGESLGVIDTGGAGSIDQAKNLVVDPTTGIAYVMIPSSSLTELHLWTLDPSTMVATKGPEVVLPDNGAQHFDDMKFDPITGELVGSLVDNFNFEAGLFTIDLVTGDTSRVDAYLPDWLSSGVADSGFGSFDLISTIPEPNSVGLAVLAATTTLVLRRRSAA